MKRLVMALAIMGSFTAFDAAAAPDPQVTEAMAVAARANQQRDYARARAIYERIAAAGHVEGMMALGTLYYGGIGVERDLSRGCDYWQQASDKGDAFSTHALGDCFFKGLGRPRDYAKSMALYQKASAAGQVTAYCAMGNHYFFGFGVPKDIKRALELCTKAADMGSADAQADLGYRYRRGNDVPRSPSQAEALLLRATKQGHINAAIDLGEMYLIGDGIPKNASEAARLFRMVEAAKDPRAPYWMGKYFSAQLPVETDSAYMPTLAKATWWYTVAAKYDPIKENQDYARSTAQKTLQDKPALAALIKQLQQDDPGSFRP